MTILRKIKQRFKDYPHVCKDCEFLVMENGNYVSCGLWRQVVRYHGCAEFYPRKEVIKNNVEDKRD